MNKIISFASTEGVTFSGKLVTVAGDAPLFTLLGSSPLRRNGGDKQAFKVKFLTKDRRTAMGFSATKLPNIKTYLTPDYYSGRDYVSMGGAGYFYPTRSRATQGYGNGDTIRVEIDFVSKSVNYMVNGASVGSSVLRCDGDVDSVYPFVSCEGGPIVMEIEYD